MLVRFVEYLLVYLVCFVIELLDYVLMRDDVIVVVYIAVNMYVIA